MSKSVLPKKLNKEPLVDAIFELRFDECIALLDDLHTIRLDSFEGIQERNKILTLNQIGFYIFLFKLSVHFCRFHEEVDR